MTGNSRYGAAASTPFILQRNIYFYTVKTVIYQYFG
jgi:hypothetical protein